MFKELSRLINNYLWDDKDGVYYPYNVNTGKREPKLICSTFDPFRLNIARPEQIERLIPKLLDPNLFNWDKIPLTTVAKTHPQYNEPTEWGQGDAWLGNVWMLRNLSTIKGLINIGRHDLAAELSWKTIKAFNGNFAESIVPSTGEAFGVKRYCWSATGYVQTIIEHLFGVDYDATRGKLCVMPHIPKELKNEAISIKDLILPTSGNTRLSVTVSPGKISGGRLISIEIDGDLEQNIDVVVLQPESPEREAPRVMEPTTGIKFEFVKELGDTKNVVGIRSPMIKELKVRFEL